MSIHISNWNKKFIVVALAIVTFTSLIGAGIYFTSQSNQTAKAGDGTITLKPGETSLFILKYGNESPDTDIENGILKLRLGKSMVLDTSSLKEFDYEQIKGKDSTYVKQNFDTLTKYPINTSYVNPNTQGRILLANAGIWGTMIEYGPFSANSTSTGDNVPAIIPMNKSGFIAFEAKLKDNILSLPNNMTGENFKVGDKLDPNNQDGITSFVDGTNLSTTIAGNITVVIGGNVSSSSSNSTSSAICLIPEGCSSSSSNSTSSAICLIPEGCSSSSQPASSASSSQTSEPASSQPSSVASSATSSVTSSSNNNLRRNICKDEYNPSDPNSIGCQLIFTTDMQNKIFTTDMQNDGDYTTDMQNDGDYLLDTRFGKNYPQTNKFKDSGVKVVFRNIKKDDNTMIADGKTCNFKFYRYATLGNNQLPQFVTSKTATTSSGKCNVMLPVNEQGINYYRVSVSVEGDTPQEEYFDVDTLVLGYGG
jgi:hypothetical protein